VKPPVLHRRLPLFVREASFASGALVAAAVVASLPRARNQSFAASFSTRLETQEEVSHGSRCAVVAARHSNSDHTHNLAARRAARVILGAESKRSSSWRSIFEVRGGQYPPRFLLSRTACEAVEARCFAMQPTWKSAENALSAVFAHGDGGG